VETLARTIPLAPAKPLPSGRIASRLTLNQEVVGANPTSASLLLPCGVTATFRFLTATFWVRILAGQLETVESKPPRSLHVSFPNSCGAIGRRSGLKNRLLWVQIPPGVLELGIQLRTLNSELSLHSCSPTGRGAGFRNQRLWVRLPPGVLEFKV
jgi:hypothetical protein